MMQQLMSGAIHLYLQPDRTVNLSSGLENTSSRAFDLLDRDGVTTDSENPVGIDDSWAININIMIIVTVAIFNNNNHNNNNNNILFLLFRYVSFIFLFESFSFGHLVFTGFSLMD